MINDIVVDIFSFLLNFLGGVIQIIILPINKLIELTLPDLSTKIIEVTETIGSMFNCITWALGVVPAPILTTLFFIISVEIARHTIYVSTHLIQKLFEIVRRIKFW